MNKGKPMQAWVSEVSRVVRMPSWIARKALSTRPPISSRPSAAPPVSSPPDPPEAGEVLSAPVVSLLEPPPPAAVDLTTSIALAQLADENAALRAQIAEMAATMAGLRREVLASSEKDLVRLALTIAERVVGRELALDPNLIVAWARDAIERLAAKDNVVIAVARDVRDSVADDSWGVQGIEHRVQTEAQLASGIVEVRTPEGSVATGVEARLAAIAEVLGVSDP
jgi:flagellar assembly protein FliH